MAAQKPGTSGFWPRSLLEAVVADSLEPSYAAVARRKKAEPAPPPSRLRVKLVTLVGLLLVGLVGVLAVVQANARDFPEASTKRSLLEELNKRDDDTAALRAQVANLRAQIAAAKEDALAAPGSGGDGKSLVERQAELRALTGLTPVSGEGVVVKVDDAAASGSSDSSDPRSADAPPPVLDRDLQGLVNGLWAAGAEDVAVGDYRLTNLTAIRAAGEAILVDYRPLLRPYTIRAIGDPDTLAAAVDSGAAGRRLRFLRDTAGVTLTIEKEAAMTLPGAPDVVLRSATTLNSEGARASSSRSAP